MELKRIWYKIKPPCYKCPYRLGTLRIQCDPCPCARCKMGDYLMYEWFQEEASGTPFDPEKI